MTPAQFVHQHRNDKRALVHELALISVEAQRTKSARYAQMVNEFVAALEANGISLKEAI